jgi:PKD repeat protein
MKPNPIVGFLLACLLSAALPLNGSADPEPIYSLSYDYSKLLFDVDRGSVYRALPERRVIARHDLITGQELATVALALAPTDAAMTPDGRRLFVGGTQMHPDGFPTDHPGKIAEIDLETFTLVREYDYPYSPRNLVARDDGVLVVGNPDPATGHQEVRLFHTGSGAQAGPLVATWLNLSLDPSQQSFFCYGLGNLFLPNVRSFFRADPLRFGGRRQAPDHEMVAEVYPSPDGELLVSGGRFYRGAPQDPLLDMTLIEIAPTAVRYYGVTRFEPPDGQTFVVAGHGLAFFRRDRLEPFAIVPLGGEYTLDAAYVGDMVYAVVLEDLFTVRMTRLPNPALGMEDNQPPSAAFVWSPTAPTDRDDVRFDASMSTDDEPAVGNLTYRWDFDSDGVFETEASNDPVVVHQFRAAGIHKVTLEVRDRYGDSSQITQSFNVTAVPDPGEPFGPHELWKIPFRATELVFDPIRPVLYAANLTNQTLVQMDLATGRITRHWQMDALVSGMAVRPDGSRLYLGLTTNDVSMFDARGNGWIADFDLIGGQKDRAFTANLDPLNIVATDVGGILVYGESTPYRQLQLYDAVAGTRLSALRLDDFSLLALHPAQQVIYAAQSHHSSPILRYWLTPGTGLLAGPSESLHLAGGRVFPMPNGTNLVTTLGMLLTASPEPGPVSDMALIRDLGLGPVVNVLPLPDRDLVGLIQWTGRSTNGLVFLWDRWETELLRLPVDARLREVARYGDRYYLAGSSGTNTWVESRRIPARTIEENTPPSVTLLAPSDGVIVLLGSVVELRAAATDEDGLVTSLRFLNGEDDLGTATAPGYSLNWQPAESGTYIIAAVATDNLGVSNRTPPITLIINAAPTITLSDPNADGTLVSPADFVLEAEAHDPDGTIAEVEFLHHAHGEPPVRLGVVTEMPYRLEITGFNGIDGFIEAVARDNLGATANVFRPLRVLGPIGDDLRRPLVLSGTEMLVRTNNVGATTQIEEPLRLNLDPPLERTLWWKWTAPADGVLRCSTRGSSFDTQIIVVRGTHPSIFQPMVVSRHMPQHDLARTIKVPVASGVDYLIGVGSYRAHDQGLITLHLLFEQVESEPADPPVNDNFVDRIPLHGSVTTTAGTNLGATRESLDPTHHPVALGTPRRTVWWSWTAPGAGIHRISTRGSDFDTLLTVSVEGWAGAVVPILINDDESADALTSSVLLDAVENQTYFIMVDGFGAHTGNIQLHIEPAQDTEPPPNDAFADRQMLDGSLPLARGTTFNATTEPGEPTNSLSDTAAGGHTVWYSWIAPRDAYVRARILPDRHVLGMGLNVYTGDSLDTLMRVEAGLLSPFATGINKSFRWHAAAGQAYHLQINASADTDFTLAVDATLDEELPRLTLAHVGGLMELELTSPAPRRVQLQASNDLASWEILADLWLEGTIHLAPESPWPGATRFFRTVAF